MKLTFRWVETDAEKAANKRRQCGGEPRGEGSGDGRSLAGRAV